MVLGKNILQALFLKGTSNVPPRGGKKGQHAWTPGVAREISLSKAVKMESYFWFQGERTCWSQSGINLKSGWRKMQKISKSLNLYHKIAKQMMTWGRNFFKACFPVLYDSAGKAEHSPDIFSVHKSNSSSHFLPHRRKIQRDPSSLLLGYTESHWLFKRAESQATGRRKPFLWWYPIEVLSHGSNSPSSNFPLLNRPHPGLLGCNDICFLWHYSCGVTHEKDSWRNPPPPPPLIILESYVYSTVTRRKVARYDKPWRGRPGPSQCRCIFKLRCCPFPCLSPHLSSWCQCLFVTLSVWCYCQEHTCSCLHYSHLRANCFKKYSWK